MSGIFAKLNLRDQRDILVLDAPVSFRPELDALRNVRVVEKLAAVERLTFALAFATRKAQLDAHSKALAAKAQGDMVIWFAYPKGTSKRLSCDFNRDSGWGVIRAAGFDAVRQVAIDADWTALRFRRVEYEPVRYFV